MTESEWDECANPFEMLRALEGLVSDRKLRLFACACARRAWHLLSDARSRRAVELSEAYASGRVSDEELVGANAAAYLVSSSMGWRGTQHAAAAAAEQASEHPTYRRYPRRACEFALQALSTPGTRNEDVERRAQCGLLREVVGNPFRPPHLDRAWLAWEGGTVVRLAEAIDEDRAFERLPILADALEDAGCNHAEVLAHLRSPGPHVPGCWPVGLLLDKEGA
jgi:hypothetical protein